MALAVRQDVAQAQRPVLVAAERRPYRCGGTRPDPDHRSCNRRVGDIEGDNILLVVCERCHQEHVFTLQTARERELAAQVAALLAILAHLSYDGGTSAT